MQFTILLQSCRIHLLLISYIIMAMQSECTLSGLYLFLYKVIIITIFRPKLVQEWDICLQREKN